MTKRKLEIKVKKEIDAITCSEEALFNLNIIDIQSVSDCDNDGEAMVQVNLHIKNSVQSAVLTLLYFNKVSRKEEKLNIAVFLENDSLLKLFKKFKSHLSKDVLEDTQYPDVVDTMIAKHLLSLYKIKKKEYQLNPVGV